MQLELATADFFAYQRADHFWELIQGLLRGEIYSWVYVFVLILVMMTCYGIKLFAYR